MGKSYISRCFTYMALCMTFMLIVLGMIVYHYFELKIVDEIIVLNQTVSEQTVDNISEFLYETSSLCKDVSADSQLIETLQETFKKNINNGLDGAQIERSANAIISEKINSLGLSKRDFVYGEFFLYSEPHTRVNETDDGFNLIDTFITPEKKSIYKYNFKIVKEVIDYLNGEVYGYIEFTINEKLLADCFSFMETNRKKFYIINEEGKMISNKNKSLLTQTYYEQAFFKEIGRFSHMERNHKSYFSFSMKVPQTNWYLISEVDKAVITNAVSPVKWFILVVIVVSLLIITLINRYFAGVMTKPIRYIIEILEQVTKGNLDIKAEFEDENEFSRIGDSFNNMIRKINELLQMVKTKESQKRLVELDLLRAQINPHFIYNTLSSIRFYVEMDKNEKAEEMLYFFSKVLRKILSRSDEFVTIQEELETLDSYVKLQELRYTDEFKVIYNIEETILNLKMPAFILQPIVENAIFYNSDTNKVNLICISVSQNKDCLEIMVKDDGIGMSEEKIKTIFSKDANMNKVGITNVNERIKLLYGAKYGLNITSIKGTGTTVKYILPITAH